MSDDVPITVDFRFPDVAAKWVAEADVKRPYRAGVRRHIAELVAGRARILELGCGPGLLAEAILDACEVERYVCLDNAQPMLDMAKQRLGDRAQYVLASMHDALPVDGPFDAIVTMQAIHELRHKRHAQPLYARLRSAMQPGGVLIVCDHAPLPDDDRPLMMTADEQLAAMTGAGFASATLMATQEKLYICRCELSA